MIKEFIENLFNVYKITDIAIDSRKANKHSAFFAIDGYNQNAETYIYDAIRNGVRLVFTQNPNFAKNKTLTANADKIIYVNDVNDALMIASMIFYPKEPKYKCAVTGTNGKTSIASYFLQICNNLNMRAASLGTLGVSCPSVENLKLEQNLTTMDFVTNKKNLYELAKNNVDYVCMEASSHGLTQNRLGDIKFNVAAFSSFSQDHLDYHESMKNYLEAKLTLFKNNASPNATFIVNRETNYYNEIIAFLHLECYAKIITVGYLNSLNSSKYNRMSVNCNIIDLSIKDSKHTIIKFEYRGKIFETEISVIGSFQAINILISALMVESLGIDFQEIVKILPLLKAPIGRLDRIEDSNVFIDYAHSPESLKLAIEELQKIKHNKDSKLITLLGCGGNRDKSKRKIMGMIAAELSDLAIITDDNPRTEDPALIRADILSSVYSKNVIEIPGRDIAIKKAIELMNKDDILLIAGKGHEKFQFIGNSKIEFDEFKIVKEYLKI